MLPHPFFSKSQKKILSATLTFAAIITFATLIILVFLGLGSVLHHFRKVIWPLVIASVLCLLLKPLVSIISEHTRLSLKNSVLLLYALSIIFLSGIFFFLIPALINQTIELVYFISQLSKSIWQSFASYFPTTLTAIQDFLGIENLAQYTEQLWVPFQQLLLHTLSNFIKLTAEVSNFFTWIVALAAIPIYLFFLLGTHFDFTAKLQKELYFVNELWKNNFLVLFQEFTRILVAFFRGQFLIAIAMSCLYTIGFFTVGLHCALILGITIGLLSIVPYLGTIIALLLTLPIALFQDNGGWQRLLLTLGVIAAVQLIESYFLTPKIMRQKTGLHPMIIILSIFFWGTAFSGVLGMILAIPLTAFFIAGWRLVKQTVLDERPHV